MPGGIYLRSKMEEFYYSKMLHDTVYFTNTNVAWLAFETIDSF